MELLNKQDRKGNKIFSLAFAEEAKISEMLLKYLMSIPFENHYDLLFNKLPTDKDVPMMVLSRVHPKLFIHLIKQWIKNSKHQLFASLLMRSSFHRKTFLSLMISTLPSKIETENFSLYKSQIKEILEILFE